MEKPTVVVPYYNTWKLLQLCIHSLQRYGKDNYEILVVDNGSVEPASYKEIEELGASVIRNETNLGFTKAMNQGIEACTGDIIAFNSDAFAMEGWFSPLVEAAYCEEKVGCVCPQHLLNGNNTALNELTYPGFPNVVYRPDGRVRLAWAGFTVVYLRRAAVEDVGLLEESCWHYSSDEFWCREAIKKGWKILYEPRSRVSHLGAMSLQELVKRDIATAREKVDSSL